MTIALATFGSSPNESLISENKSNPYESPENQAAPVGGFGRRPFVWRNSERHGIACHRARLLFREDDHCRWSNCWRFECRHQLVGGGKHGRNSRRRLSYEPDKRNLCGHDRRFESSFYAEGPHPMSFSYF